MNQARRGANSENAVKDDLGAMGYDVIRSAGSKGAADLLAIHDREIVFIQVKLAPVDQDRFVMPTPAERRECIRIARRVGGVPVAATRFPGSGSRRPRTEYRLLTGPGPRDCMTWTPQDSREYSPVASEPEQLDAASDRVEITMGPVPKPVGVVRPVLVPGSHGRMRL